MPRKLIILKKAEYDIETIYAFIKNDNPKPATLFKKSFEIKTAFDPFACKQLHRLLMNQR